jgi:hypothetical protein
MGSFCRRQIHFKLQRLAFLVLALHQETDRSTSIQKVRRFSNRQDVRPCNRLQDFSVSFRLRTAHEQKVTASQLLIIVQPPHLHSPSLWRRSSGDFRQRSTKRKIPSDAYHKRSSRRSECRFRPFHEIQKSHQAIRLAPVLRKSRPLSEKIRRDHPESAGDGQAQAPKSGTLTQTAGSANDALAPPRS